MAVTIVGTPASNSVFGAVQLSISVTVPAGADALFVGGGSGPTTFSSATFNGVAMTEVWDVTDSGAVTCFGYLILAPSVGTFNVLVNAAGAVDIWGGAVCFAGVEQSSVAAAHRTIVSGAGGNAGPPTVTATSVSGDVVVSSAATLNATIAIAGGDTSQAEVDDLAGNTLSIGVSTGAAVDTTKVMSWTGGTFWGMGAMALIAAAGGGGRTTKNTRSAPLGVNVGMGWRMAPEKPARRIWAIQRCLYVPTADRFQVAA